MSSSPHPFTSFVAAFLMFAQLQTLFARLQLSELSAVETVALTRSFGWEENQVFEQQDVQVLR
jgi:hypothetical protein